MTGDGLRCFGQKAASRKRASRHATFTPVCFTSRTREYTLLCLALLQVDDHRIRALAIGRQNNVDIAPPRQTGGYANIGLIQTNQGWLCAGENHFRAGATDRCSHVRQ